MAQEDNVYITVDNNRTIEIKDAIAKIDKSLKKLENCIKIGTQEGIRDIDLIPWCKKVSELKESKNRLNGELHHIYHTCEHEYIMIGTRQTLFGEECIYQCNKCGYQTLLK